MSYNRKYDSNLLKGTGLIEETLVLLEAYEKGISKSDFYKKVFELDLLSKSTEARVKDIIKSVFERRYWSAGVDVISALKKMRAAYVSMEVFRQIFMIYTCRANPILHDFITQSYWNFWDKGYQVLTQEDYEKFIKDALIDGRIEKIWNDNTVYEVGKRINACLIDFKFIDGSKTIIPIRILEKTANYLVHELHFSGYSDNQILLHPDWKLFNLTKSAIVEILQRISWQGHFIVQYSGEILNISWEYDSMEQFVDGFNK